MAAKFFDAHTIRRAFLVGNPANGAHFRTRREFSAIARLRGGAGRTRTNNQSVMEHGWCPTNSPGRTPIQIPEALLFLRDYPGVLRRAVHVGPTGPFLKAGFLEIPLLWKSPSIADFLSASTGVRRGGLVGHPPCSITLWWLVRVRPAPPRSHLQ